tara:strand:- start:197 stop:670 length:474 start_codon:yes stop_codon:yes gene_type:complete
MKSFQQFISEASKYEPKDSTVGSDVPLEVGKIGQDRSKGKYKARKDIGKQRPRSEREQQPTKERGSVKLDPKAAQRKAYLERKAREKGAKTKSADELLRKKDKPKTDPKYKPREKSGLTTKQRKALYKKGERTLRDIVLQATGKKSEKELKHKITSK